MFVLCITVFSALYNIPRFWEITWLTIVDPATNATIAIYDTTPLRTNEIYINVYINWLYLLVMYALPFTGLAAFNLMIYSAVKKAGRERQRLTRLQQKELGLATMLMAVVSVFFVCNALPFVLNVLEAAGCKYVWLNNVSSLLVVFNSSANFIIYCIFGGKFKRIFFRLFCPQGEIQDVL